MIRRRVGGSRLAGRVPRTVRVRLTMLYGGMFLLAGVALIAVTYTLLRHRSPVRRTVCLGGVCPQPLPPPSEDLRAQQAAWLHQFIEQSAIALAITGVLAFGLGWVLAGQVLRPLRRITATARRLSTANLDERINLPGPSDELTDLADTFDAMLARLSAAFTAQRHFVANASHELRTPLTTQRSAVEVALADPTPTVASLRKMGEFVLSATERHERLIDGLLALAGSERGIERYEPVELAEMTGSCLSTVEVPAGVSVRPALGAAPLLGDGRLLERLVVNLVDNALRYNVAGGHVDVQTGRQDDGRVRLRIANSGPPVPPDAVDSLFQPFRRHAAGRVRTAASGVGLGLSIVAAVAAAHGGGVNARARSAGGLEITVLLPPGPPQRA